MAGSAKYASNLAHCQGEKDYIRHAQQKEAVSSCISLSLSLPFRWTQVLLQTVSFFLRIWSKSVEEPNIHSQHLQVQFQLKEPSSNTWSILVYLGVL